VRKLLIKRKLIIVRNISTSSPNEQLSEKFSQDLLQVTQRQRIEKRGKAWLEKGRMHMPN
jgi:hypothetical protein